MNKNMIHTQILDTYKKYCLRRMLYDVLSALFLCVGLMAGCYYLRNSIFSQMSESDLRNFLNFVFEEFKNTPVVLLIGILVGVFLLAIVPKCISAQGRFFKRMKWIKEGRYSVSVEVVKHNFAIQRKIRSAGEGQRFRIIHCYKTAEHERVNIVNGFNFRAFPGQEIYVVTFLDGDDAYYPDGIKMKKNRKGEQDGT